MAGQNKKTPNFKVFQQTARAFLPKMIKAMQGASIDQAPG
jgi:hypothetical protein